MVGHWPDSLDVGGGADHVFVATGAIAAFDTAARYLGFHGRMTIVGMPHSGQTTRYEPVVVAATGQQILGSKMGDGVPKLVELNLPARPAEPLIRDWLDALVEPFHAYYEAHAAELEGLRRAHHISCSGLVNDLSRAL